MLHTHLMQQVWMLNSRNIWWNKQMRMETMENFFILYLIQICSFFSYYGLPRRIARSSSKNSTTTLTYCHGRKDSRYCPGGIFVLFIAHEWTFNELKHEHLISYQLWSESSLNSHLNCSDSLVLQTQLFDMQRHALIVTLIWGKYEHTTSYSYV